MRRHVSPGDDIVDIREVIKYFEELEELCGDKTLQHDVEDPSESDIEDYEVYKEFLAQVCGCGSDHPWRGDYYPSTFIADSYFTEYAQQYADDIGAIDCNASWPLCHIDWEAAASSLQQDFSSVEFGNVTYWYQG